MNFKDIKKINPQHISTLLFLGGFIFDLIILPDAGHLMTIWIGLAYLSIVAACIALREWVISQNTASKKEQKLFTILTFLIAYFSGSSLSFVCVYAIRSAALSVSWPLLLVLFLCVLANEVVATHHFRLTLDVGILLIATFFFVIFNFPILLNVQNDVTFFISTLITIGISLLYLFFLKYTSESAREEAPKLYSLAFGIPMFIGMLYFLNVIPAVPLALSQAGIYHSVVRTEDGGFRGEKELDSRFLKALRTPVYHISPDGNGIFFFGSITAPAELTAPISHVWEYYDTTTNQWTKQATISFTLAGGREDGYRAYSQKENITEGLWRVTVKVDSKRIVGRVRFNVVTDTTKKVLLVEEKL